MMFTANYDVRLSFRFPPNLTRASIIGWTAFCLLSKRAVVSMEFVPLHFRIRWSPKMLETQPGLKEKIKGGVVVSLCR